MSGQSLEFLTWRRRNLNAYPDCCSMFSSLQETNSCGFEETHSQPNSHRLITPRSSSRIGQGFGLDANGQQYLTGL